MRPLSVAFLADHYVGWMGGAHLLANLLNCVNSVAANQSVRVTVLMDMRGLGAAVPPGTGNLLSVEVANLRVAGPLQCLLDTTRTTHIVFYRDLRAAVQELGVQVIGPTAINLGTDFPIPWFGYICDFQHQYLADLFSQQERVQRDQLFRSLVENATGVFVTSATAAVDLERFYPAAAKAKQVLRMPTAMPDLADVTPPAAALARYGLARPFFLSCSQRWMHKQHPLILRAFAEMVAPNPQMPLDLVFTGDTSDYRDPAYSGRVDELIAALGLTDRVHVLGQVPRADQLALIRSTLAVVQASLFEGQAGASGTMEAALLGTRIIASDIATNRELPFGRMRFFAADSASALAAQMAAVVAESPAGAAAGLPVDATPFDDPSRQLLEMASGLNLLATLRAVA
jgi:glycosyltransferase involved in cell wall biosynthesis